MAAPYVDAVPTGIDATTGLPAENAVILKSMRFRALNVAITALCVGFAAWVSWFGLVACVAIGWAAISLRSRCTDRHSLLYYNGGCCCGSTPDSQLRQTRNWLVSGMVCSVISIGIGIWASVYFTLHDYRGIIALISCFLQVLLIFATGSLLSGHGALEATYQAAWALEQQQQQQSGAGGQTTVVVAVPIMTSYDACEVPSKTKCAA